jgi:8-oxo-dGTP pyrophosphatase MutT (NUDIX family)
MLHIPRCEKPMELLTSRKLSCGVVVLNDAAELLLCHVTGQDHWDLPKGGANEGESPLAAALRETREETSLRLDPTTLLDLGRRPFRPRKDLHLFATLLPRLDPADLGCDSHFDCRRTGVPRPEMDGYGWFAFGRLTEYCRPALADVLTRQIDLASLLQRLRQRHAVAA